MNTQTYVDLRIDSIFEDLSLFSYTLSENYDKRFVGYELMIKNAKKQISLFTEEHDKILNSFERQTAIDLCKHINRICKCFQSTVDVLIYDNILSKYKLKVKETLSIFDEFMEELETFFISYFKESNEYLIFDNIKETKDFLKSIQEKI